MDSNYIRACIIGAGLTQNRLAEAVGMSEGTLSLKINGKADFTRKEMLEIASLLKTDVGRLFFHETGDDD